MLVFNKIIEEMGEKWVDNTIGHPQPKDAGEVADLVYFHHLESEQGRKAWFSDSEQTEEKVNHIFESIHIRYVHELEWMTEEEWQGISDELYSMVHEGVF